MAVANRWAGIAYFKIDGIQYSFQGSGKVKISTVKRDPIVNMDSTVGFKEMPVNGEISLDLTTVQGFSAQLLNGITNATITLDAANGTSYVLQNAFQFDEMEIDTDSGKCTAKFAGYAIEQLPVGF